MIFPLTSEKFYLSHRFLQHDRIKKNSIYSKWAGELQNLSSTDSARCAAFVQNTSYQWDNKKRGRVLTKSKRQTGTVCVGGGGNVAICLCELMVAEAGTRPLEWGSVCPCCVVVGPAGREGREQPGAIWPSAYPFMIYHPVTLDQHLRDPLYWVKFTRGSSDQSQSGLKHDAWTLS